MGLFVEKKSGGRIAALLGGLGIGAALMYLLDPERGRRRRALARDKAVSIANKTGNVVARRSRDIGNRAKGVVAEVRSSFQGKAAGGFEDEGHRPDSSDQPEFSTGSRAPQSAAGGAEGGQRRESRQLSGDEDSGRRIEEEGEL